jgi:hypothetical protein
VPTPKKVRPLTGVRGIVERPRLRRGSLGQGGATTCAPAAGWVDDGLAGLGCGGARRGTTLVGGGEKDR